MCRQLQNNYAAMLSTKVGQYFNVIACMQYHDVQY